jgi:hypothetical protein
LAVGGGQFAVEVGGSALQVFFFGSEDNLIGLKQDRLAGQQMMFNNLGARIKLNSFLCDILPGQYGLSGFYDIGRVWVRAENADRWHNGIGAGVYFSPSDMALLQLKGSYSGDGFYPYINFRLTL